MTQYWREVVVKGNTFGSRTKRMETQCNQGYPYKFATKCIGKNKNEYVIPKNCNLYKYVKIFFQICAPFSYPHYDLRRQIEESLHHSEKTRSEVQKGFCLF